MAKGGYSCFRNEECEFFPCHADVAREEFNCLFCFCPLYHHENCGGRYTRLESGIKDCSGCSMPHWAENYHKVIKRLSGPAQPKG